MLTRSFIPIRQPAGGTLGFSSGESCSWQSRCGHAGRHHVPGVGFQRQPLDRLDHPPCLLRCHLRSGPGCPPCRGRLLRRHFVQEETGPRSSREGRHRHAARGHGHSNRGPGNHGIRSTALSSTSLARGSKCLRIRMLVTPRPTKIQWTRHKGLLGMCWDELDKVPLNHQEHFREHMNCTKRQWKKDVPVSIKRGLTYEDYKQIRQFGYVVAYPVVEDQYRGCLVLQVETRYQSAIEYFEEEIDRTMNGCAGMIARLLK